MYHHKDCQKVVLDCVTQCSQSAAHLYEQFLQVQQMGSSHWDPYAVQAGGCNMVEWFWWDMVVSFSALSL